MGARIVIEVIDEHGNVYRRARELGPRATDPIGPDLLTEFADFVEEAGGYALRFGTEGHPD